MQLGHVARYFKQGEFSDVDLEIKLLEPPSRTAYGGLPAKRAKHAADEGRVLAQFPAHRLVLAGIEYFKAQVQAWAPCNASCSDAAAETSSAACSRAKLQLTIDSAGQLPAAEAVIAAMYGLQNALSCLEQRQLVDAAVVADRIGAAGAAEQAVHGLKAVAEQPIGLSAAALEALASLVAWPTCLQALLLPVVARAPCCTARKVDVTNYDMVETVASIAAADTGGRLQSMLLAVLGDLEAVWRDSQLQELLQQLPLPAMQLLLSSDKLRVASEDTVLYTVNVYVVKQRAWPAGAPPAQQQSAATAATAAAIALAPLVRAQHLSRFALSCHQAALQAPGSGSRPQPLHAYSEQVRLLASYKLLTAGGGVPADVLVSSGAPPSWWLGKRQIRDINAVRLVWRLPVERLTQACRDSFSGDRRVLLISDKQSPPVGGVAWNMQLDCRQLATNGECGTVIGLYATPALATGNISVFCVFQCTLSGGVIRSRVCCPGSLHGGGHWDFFRLSRPMSAGGGWDEAAWAAKGLPTAGELELSLHMHSVGA